MIKVARASKPAILVNEETNWLNTLLAASTPAETDRACKKYRHPQVQEALQTMFQEKCAYCESHVNHVSDAHIEHYRPKSKFPQLTFDWDNLLLACGKCNSTRYKGDKFPTVNEGGLLINPCLDDPDDHFEFVYDARAKLASVSTRTVRGETSEKILGLNRSELRQHRSIHITRLLALARLAALDKEAQDLLIEAKQDSAEYAAFTRKLL